MGSLNTSFSLKEDTKEVPVVPAGSYKGAITDVEYDTKKGLITILIALSGNADDLVMSDGETPVNGAHIVNRISVPLAGDRKKASKNPALTVHEAKANIMADIFEAMNWTDIDNQDDLDRALKNKEWIGQGVFVNTSVGSWRNRPTVNVLDMYPWDEEEEYEDEDE